MFVVVNAFMYNQILSDGDSSMFAVLRKLNHYGADHPVIKLDCVNHAEKRMGASLRKLMKHQKSLVVAQIMIWLASIYSSD